MIFSHVLYQLSYLGTPDAAASTEPLILSEARPIRNTAGTCVQRVRSRARSVPAVPAFAEQSDAGQYFLVEHAHVTARLLVPRADREAGRRKLCLHVDAELQQLRFQRGDPTGQLAQFVHLTLQYGDAILE